MTERRHDRPDVSEPVDVEWDRFVRAWLQWCDQVNSYELVADSPHDLARVLRPAREDYERSGIVPDWCGPHLLAAWLFYLYRADRAGGDYSLQHRDQPAAREFASVAAALATTPPWSQPPPYRRPLNAMKVAATLPAVPTQLGSLAAEHQLNLVTRTLPDQGVEEYLYSPDMLYRYAFARWWATPDLATVTTWVLLNPATGDTDGKKRQTLGRCEQWSKAWGSNGLVIVNLFAYRATQPRELTRTPDPVGPANDAVLTSLAHTGQRTVVAWGSGGDLLGRSAHVGALLDDPQCLGTTSMGQPRHPSRVAATVELLPWRRT